MINVGVLTSSRADYGIYKPLLKAMSIDEEVNYGLIVFGTHLSKHHGYTFSEIEEDGHVIDFKVESLLVGDTPNSISTSYALTAQKFADVWALSTEKYDVIIALGDRYEMAAAVAASIPFRMKIAHLFGGETTLGAIDNVYRHCISLASDLHFVSTEKFKRRLTQILGHNHREMIFNVGSLSLENIESIELLSVEIFRKKWGIDLLKKTILITVHPETLSVDENEDYCNQVVKAVLDLKNYYQIIITMPNADTNGIVYRSEFEKLGKTYDSVITIENFGIQSYFTCMKYVGLLIGNTSSGIVEAASFGKYVINLGDRQKGRLSGKNVIHIPFDAAIISSQAKQFFGRLYQGSNMYFKHKPSLTMVSELKKRYG